MYHSWWFQSVIVLLTVNIVVCSIDRLSATRKILFVRKPSFDVSRFRKLKNKETFDDDRSPEQIRTLYASYFERAFRHSQMENTEKGFCIFGEKGRWTRFGVYTVHLSVILLLVGGLIGSIFGFDGFANIPEGETVTSVRLGNNGKTLPLPFELRCDDFNVSFYDSGMPKEYRSSLTVLEDGQPVLTKEIIVNDPLRYKGISMFQSSYGPMPPNKASLNLTSKQTGMIYKKQVIVGEVIELPENLGTFVLNGFDSAASFRGQNIGEALRGTLTPKQGNPVEILLPLRFPSFDKMRRGELVIAVAELQQRFFTGLQVTSDPGVWLVYMGFIVMILGCYITFFMSHQQVCVDVTARGKNSRIIVAGTSNKNKMGMQKKVAKLSERLAGLNGDEPDTMPSGTSPSRRSSVLY
jgi:cytochrome c biogenesis protein